MTRTDITCFGRVVTETRVTKDTTTLQFGGLLDALQIPGVFSILPGTRVVIALSVDNFDNKDE